MVWAIVAFLEVLIRTSSSVYVVGRVSNFIHRTSGMAEDVITLLEHVGWTTEYDIHIVGISLGGMIAQGKGYNS